MRVALTSVACVVVAAGAVVLAGVIVVAKWSPPGAVGALNQVIPLELAVAVLPLTVAAVAAQLVTGTVGSAALAATQLLRRVILPFGVVLFSLVLDILVLLVGADATVVSLTLLVAALAAIVALAYAYVLIGSASVAGVVAQATRALTLDWWRREIESRPIAFGPPRQGSPDDPFLVFDRLLAQAMGQADRVTFVNVLDALQSRLWELMDATRPVSATATRGPSELDEARFDTWLDERWSSLLDQADSERRSWAIQELIYFWLRCMPTVVEPNRIGRPVHPFLAIDLETATTSRLLLRLMRSAIATGGASVLSAARATLSLYLRRVASDPPSEADVGDLTGPPDERKRYPQYWSAWSLFLRQLPTLADYALQSDLGNWVEDLVGLLWSTFDQVRTHAPGTAWMDRMGGAVVGTITDIVALGVVRGRCVLRFSIQVGTFDPARPVDRVAAGWLAKQLRDQLEGSGFVIDERAARDVALVAAALRAFPDERSEIGAGMQVALGRISVGQSRGPVGEALRDAAAKLAGSENGVA